MRRKRRRTASLLCLLLMLITLFTPIVAFADGGGGTSFEIKVLLGNESDTNDLMAPLYNLSQKNEDGEEDEEDQELYIALLDSLKTELNHLTEDDICISQARNIIDECIADAGYGFNEGEGIKKLWIAEMGPLAEAYGIPELSENLTTAEEVANAGEKINMLTWDKTGDGWIDGGNKNSGQIGKLLEQLYSLSSSSGGSSSSGAGALAGSMINILKSLGMALAVAFSVMAMTEKLADRNLTGEALGRDFAKLCVGLFLIANFQYLAAAIMRLGSVILEAAQEGGEDTKNIMAYGMKYSLTQSLYKVASVNNLNAISTNIFSGFGNFFGNIFGGFVSTMGGYIGAAAESITSFVGGGIIQLVSSLAIYALLIEIGIRYCFTPIAIADLYSEKFRSSGIRYLKGLFACSLAGAVMYSIVVVTTVLKTSIDTMDPITNTMINLTMVGMFARARSIAGSIVGA